MFDCEKIVEPVVVKGIIVGFDQYGAVFVETDRESSPISCYCLRGSDAPPPRYSIGDIVAFVTLESRMEGYLLGRIEAYIPCTDDYEKHYEIPEELFKINRCNKSVAITAKTIHLEATDEATIVSGKSSVRIDSQGTVIVRGANLLSRSSGSNKIKGSSVMIN